MKIILYILIFCILYKKYKQRIRPGHNHLTIFMGIPGSGKTTLAACYAKKYIKKGFDVYSNVEIKGCYKLDPKTQLGIAEIRNALIIIDEASLEFNNRRFKEFPDNCIRFFKLHRHYHCEVIVFSQSLDMDITLQRLAFQFYIVRPHWIPFFVQACPVKRKIGINEQTHQIEDIYSLYPLLLQPLHNRSFFAPLVWPMFDSWEAPRLEPTYFQTYGDIPSTKEAFKAKIFDMQTRIREIRDKLLKKRSAGASDSDGEDNSGSGS